MTYPPQSPPTRLDTWLGSIDGFYLAAGIIFAFVALCFACWVVSLLSKRHPQPTSSPASSNRKSGRVGGGRS